MSLLDDNVMVKDMLVGDVPMNFDDVPWNEPHSRNDFVTCLMEMSILQDGAMLESIYAHECGRLFIYFHVLSFFKAVLRSACDL